MHRTFLLTRLVGCFALLLTALLHAGIQTASAQDTPVVVMTRGTTRIYSAKEDLKKVENPDPRVINIQRVVGSFKDLQFEALALGKVRVKLTDQNNREEFIDVLVVEDQVRGVHQVQLEVVVAVVNRSAARNMSFSWLTSNNNWFLGSLVGGPGALSSGLVIPPTAMTLTGSGANLPFGVLNANGGHIGFLNALRTEGLTKILAEPRLTTLSGRPAQIISGGHVDIVAAGGVSSAQISADFGTIVSFLPIVLPNGKIHLEVKPEVSTPTNSIPIPGAGGAGTVSFSVLKRAAQVTVQLEDGQTLAIGGLIQNRVDSTADKVPVLGDMPFFGAAFRKVSYQEIEEEMLILVTPRLVDGVDCTKFPKYLPGRETRGPDDFELFLEGILEAPRGPRTVRFHPHEYKGAHMNSPNIGQVPCGDGSGCGDRWHDRNRGGCATGNCGPISKAVMPSTNAVPVAMPTPSFPADLPPISVTNIKIEPEPTTLPIVPVTNIKIEPESTIPIPSPSREGSGASSSAAPPRQMDSRLVLPPLPATGTRP